jgi:hypothetical protein
MRFVSSLFLLLPVSWAGQQLAHDDGTAVFNGPAVGYDSFTAVYYDIPDEVGDGNAFRIGSVDMCVLSPTTTSITIDFYVDDDHDTPIEPGTPAASTTFTVPGMNGWLTVFLSDSITVSGYAWAIMSSPSSSSADWHLRSDDGSSGDYSWRYDTSWVQWTSGDLMFRLNGTTIAGGAALDESTWGAIKALW